MAIVERDTPSRVQLQTFVEPNGQTFYRAWLFTAFKEVLGKDGKVHHYECEMYTSKEPRPFPDREQAKRWYEDHLEEEIQLAKKEG